MGVVANIEAATVDWGWEHTSLTPIVALGNTGHIAGILVILRRRGRQAHSSLSYLNPRCRSSVELPYQAGLVLAHRADGIAMFGGRLDLGALKA